MNKSLAAVMPLRYYVGSDSFQLIELLSYIVGMKRSGFYHANQMKTFLTTLRNIHCFQKNEESEPRFSEKPTEGTNTNKITRSCADMEQQ